MEDKKPQVLVWLFLFLIAILILAISCITTGQAQQCANRFASAWKEKVASIKEWNSRHPDYVKRHHLDRDMSQNTAALKAHMRGAFEMACEQFEGVGTASSLNTFGDGMTEEIVSALSSQPRSPVDLDSPALLSMVDRVEEPSAEGVTKLTAYTPLSIGTPGYFSGPGWMGFAYGGGIDHPTAPPAVPPTNPVPELGTFPLAFTGLLSAFGLLRKSRIN